MNVSDSKIEVSAVMSTAPSMFKTPLQRCIYDTLAQLGIPFERVDCTEAITMEDCQALNRALDVEIVKTIFLTNRQLTRFYLFVTRGDKPFSTKAFSGAMGISRVSFAPADLMLEMAQTIPGAATAFSALIDAEGRFPVVFDREVFVSEEYGCTDGTTTGYMKLRTADMLRVLEHAGHTPVVITV